MELDVGAIVSGHLLREKLGSGAMGTVYRAKHPTLDRDVALKVLNSTVADHPAMRERFAREADALCRLDQHPHIVDVLDRGQDGQRLWMSMRFIPGQDLATALTERGPFLPRRAIAIVDEVGQALDFAHAHGLLHRDVKPANVLLRTDHTGTERAVLTDFGIVKDVATSHMLTEQGMGPGTLAYASPEQLEGKTLDARADVYSLGVVLFELLTGRRAFDAQEYAPLLWSVVSGPIPDIRELRPDLPPELAAVVTRAMAKDPEGRYVSCAELVAAARASLGRPAPAAETVDRPTQPPSEPRVADETVHRPTQPPSEPPVADEAATRSTAEASPAPPGRRRTGLIALTVVLLLSFAAAVVGYALTRPDDGTPESPLSSADTTAATSTGVPASTSATDGSDAPALAIGDCLDAGDSRTACDGEHRSEVFSTSDCSPDALVRHLGGVPGEDVLRPLTIRPVGGGPACAVSDAGPLTGPLADILLDRSGDVFRQCLDEVDRSVPCSEPHTDEVIFQRAAPAESLDCEARADDYLDRPFDQLSDALRLVEAGDSCVLEVRSANVLTASVRRLGTSALPLQ